MVPPKNKHGFIQIIITYIKIFIKPNTGTHNQNIKLFSILFKQDTIQKKNGISS